MPIVILLILVLGSALVAWYMPQLRAIALVVLVLFGGLLSYLFFSNGSQPDRQAHLIPISDIVLSQLDYSQDPSLNRISGNMLNNSQDYRLRSVTIRLTLHDCPYEESDFDECVIIADDTAQTFVDIPPGQLRSFGVLMSFPNLPILEGVLRWRYELIASRATG